MLSFCVDARYIPRDHGQRKFITFAISPVEWCLHYVGVQSDSAPGTIFQHLILIKDI